MPARHAPAANRWQRFGPAAGPAGALFLLDVPAHCRPEQVPAPDGAGGAFAPLAGFASSVVPGFRVGVAVAQPRREVGVEDLVRLDLERAGFEAAGERAAGSDPAAVRFLAQGGAAGGRVVRSVHARRDGAVVYRVDCEIPSDGYAAVAAEVARVHQSFRLLRPRPSAPAEAIISFSDLRFVPVRFDRPASWDVTAVATEPRGLTVHLQSGRDGCCTGRMTVKVVANPGEGGAPWLAQGHAADLRAAGVRVGGGQVVPVAPPQLGTAAWLYLPAAEHAGRQLAVPLLVTEWPEAVVLHGLVGPSRAETAEWWAVNKRAFEIVRDSLRLGADAAASRSPAADRTRPG